MICIPQVKFVALVLLFLMPVCVCVCVCVCAFVVLHVGWGPGYSSTTEGRRRAAPAWTLWIYWAINAVSRDRETGKRSAGTSRHFSFPLHHRRKRCISRNSKEAEREGKREGGRGRARGRERVYCFQNIFLSGIHWRPEGIEIFPEIQDRAMSEIETTKIIRIANLVSI